MNNKIIILATVILIGGVTYSGYKIFSQEKFACSYGPFTRIENGMTAEEVANELGEPDQKVVKDELGGNRFGQGGLEQQIKSGWLYDLTGWDGGLEIYFDTSESVIGKNCGNG